MAIDESVPRTRRALPAGGIGGLAAVVASTLGRRLPVSAADGQTVVVGGEYTASSRTLFSAGTTGATTLVGRCATALEPAVFGLNMSGVGVNGQSTSGPAFLGERASGNGVVGSSVSNARARP